MVLGQLCSNFWSSVDVYTSTEAHWPLTASDNEVLRSFGGNVRLISSCEHVPPGNTLQLIRVHWGRGE